ncbi:MAG TPA: PAS domain S-box protein [Syntrophales bacterium]|nr:PAS domain S-box protein [Syntrophales bacterium]
MKDKNKTKAPPKKKMEESAPLFAENNNGESLRKQAKRLFDDCEAHYHAIVGAFDGFIYICSPDYRIKFMNERLIERTGYNGTGELCYKVLHDRDSICPWCVNERVFNGETVRWELQSPKDDRWYYVVNTPIYNSDGSIFKQSMISDITENKRAEQALIESERKYRLLVENSNDIIYITNHRGHFIYANPVAELFFDCPMSDLLGKHFLSLVKHDFHEEIAAFYNKQFREKIPNTYLELPVVVKDGTTKWIGQNVQLLSDNSGRVVGYQAVARDITEHKLKDVLLKEAHDNLERKVEERTAELLMLNRQLKEEVEERRRIEEILRESEEKYRSLATTADSMYLVDRNCRYLFMNERHLSRFGVPLEKIIGKSYGEFHSEKSMEDFTETVKKVFQSGDCIQFEHRSERDGKYYLRTFSPVKDRGGKATVAVTVVAKDITDRKCAEESLKQSEIKYRTLVENAHEGICVVQDGKISFMNSRIMEVSGYCMEEVKSRQFIDFVHPDDVPVMIERYMKRLAGEHVARNFHARFVAKDGHFIWVEIRGEMIEWEERPAVLYFLNDITERMRAEELYRTLAESSHAGVYITQEGKFKFVNPHITEYTGYSVDELIGMNVLELAHPEDRKIAKAHAVDMLKGKRSTPYEFRIIDRKGRVKWLMETVRSINYEGKRAVLGNTMDVTDRYRMERMLHQAQKMEAIGTLAGGIAHDFNNILTAIIGYTEIARTKVPVESPVRRNLEQVLKAGSRAKDLVSQILTFSRQTEQERKPVQMAPIVNEALKLLRSSLPSTIKICQEIALTPEECIVLADPTQIHQVLMNLCTNAAHAMRDRGGVLTVTLSEVEADDSFILKHPDMRLGPYVRLMVRDTGYGINEAVIERIFDPYFTTKGPGEGTGLGLAVVQGIVKSHGGMITVHSEPDKGTTFQVFLPMISQDAVPDGKTAEVLPTGDERILFIDDENTIADLGKEILESLGYDVITKTDSQEALETFCDQPHAFDLVFTDMTMSGMTGIELAKKFMVVRPDIPIVLCTGFSELINEKTAKEQGIREFVMKPFVTSQLAKTVRKVLDEKKCPVP